MQRGAVRKPPPSCMKHGQIDCNRTTTSRLRRPDLVELTWCRLLAIAGINRTVIKTRGDFRQRVLQFLRNLLFKIMEGGKACAAEEVAAREGSSAADSIDQIHHAGRNQLHRAGDETRMGRRHGLPLVRSPRRCRRPGRRIRLPPPLPADRRYRSSRRRQRLRPRPDPAPDEPWLRPIRDR